MLSNVLKLIASICDTILSAAYASSSDYYTKTLKFWSQNEIAVATEAFDQVLIRDLSNGSARLNKKVLLNQLSRFQEALEASDQLLNQDADYCLACGDRGDTLCNLQRFQEAVVAYDQTIAMTAKKGEENYLVDVHVGREEALMTMDQLKAVLVTFNLAIQYNPQSAGAYFDEGLWC